MARTRGRIEARFVSELDVVEQGRRREDRWARLLGTTVDLPAAGSTEVEASRQLIAFLASDRAATAIKNNGMEPVEKR